MRMDLHQQNGFGRRGGFSLAEVMMAVAIASFALLALLAVLPEGLNSLQDAQRQAAEAHIVQQIGSQFQALPWNDLPQAVSGQSGDLIFDADGVQLPQGTANDRVFFRVRLSLAQALPLPNEATASPYLRRLRIQISGRGDAPLSNATAPSASRTERFLTMVNLDRADPPAAAPGTNSSGGASTPATTAPNP